MKSAALLALLLWQMGSAKEPPVARPEYMRYERTLSVPAGEGQACAVLDAQIFPHAAPSLTDLRIFSAHGDGREIPYVITLSQAMTEETQSARVLNLGGGGGPHGGRIVFDLEMPQRAYTSVTLNLDPAVHDFLATAAVSGMNSPGDESKATALGSFTLFDLTTQRLSRDTTLPLSESTFRYLHVVLNVSAAPGGANTAAGFTPALVQGAEVPPSRSAQILYSAIAETSAIATVGRESRATFEVPLRVPVERVSFVLAPGYKGNFSRDVRVSAIAIPGAKKPDEDRRALLPEVVPGSILRVHTNEAGREIRSEQLNVPAILGANLQQPAKVDVTIENGDDQPLPIAAVRLEMRQRKLCFDAPAGIGTGLALFYGDPVLVAPVYDYDRLFRASDKALAVELGAEIQNPTFRARPEAQLSFTERHPEVLWIALIAVICALGMVALRAGKNVGR